MKLSNRLERAWTPSWDLGLQDEFSFGSEAPERRAEPGARRACWGAATAAVDRGALMDRRLGRDASSVGAIIAYFETLGVSEK